MLIQSIEIEHLFYAEGWYINNVVQDGRRF